MDMQSEVKKLFSQKIILGLLAILCMSSVITLFNFKKINPFSQAGSYGYYQTYLSLYQGELTDDKLSQIEKEKTLIYDAEIERVHIYDSLQQSKQYSQEDVRLTKEKLAKSIELIKKEEAFHYFNQQVEYVNEDRANRSIMDTLGWKKILQDEQVDIILIICLLLINIPLFTIEDDNEMRTLLIATRKGKRRIFLYKCFAGATLSLLCILFFTGIRDLSYFMNYDLSNGWYTMQSIPTFQEAPFMISCNSALLLSRGIRIVGYMTLIVCIWLLSIVIKKFAIVFSIACTSIFLLYVSIPVPYIYYIPNPLALILSSGYFRGKENIILNKGSDFEFIIASYQDTNKAIQFFNIAALLFILFFLLMKSYRLYSNIRPSKKTKHIATLSLLVLCMLSGCNTKTTNKTTLPNSNISEQSAAYEEYQVTLKDNELFIKNRDGLQRLIQDPMYQTNNDEVIKGFSVAKGCIYFLKTIANSYTKGSTIFKYDIENRRVEQLYTTTQNFEEEKFFGLQKSYAIDLEDAPQFNDILKFFVYDKWLYIVNDNGNIIKESIDGRTTSVIVDDYYACLSLINDEVYYITNNLDIRTYHLRNNTSNVISKNLVSNMISDKESIYYTTFDKQGIYQYAQGETRKIVEGDYTCLAVSNRLLYIRNKQGEVFLYDKEDAKLRKTGVSNVSTITVINDYVLVSVEENGRYAVYKYDPQLEKKEGVE